MMNNTTKRIAALALAALVTIGACADRAERPASGPKAGDMIDAAVNPGDLAWTNPDTGEAWYVCTVDETRESGLVLCQHPGGRGL